METTSTTHANLARRCSHVHDGGQSCGSPALRDHDFCYYHERLHHPMPHPVKTPVAFIPPLESPEAILIATTNIARAVGQGLLTDKQARNLNASLRMARWAIEQRAKAASEGNQPDPVTELPEPMSQVLTAAHTELEPDPVAAASYPAQSSCPENRAGESECRTLLGTAECHSPARECRGTNDSNSPLSPAGTTYQTPEDTRPNRNYLRIHRGPLPKSGTRAHDDLIPVPDTWKHRPLKNFPLGAELDDNLLQYIRFVTRVGHEHPEYDEAMRRLSAHIATGASSR